MLSGDYYRYRWMKILKVWFPEQLIILFVFLKEFLWKQEKKILIIKLSARGLWNKKNNESCLRGGCVQLELKC